MAETDPDGWPELTPRLLDVLRLLAQGYTDKQIGGRLGISHSTVRVHVVALARLLIPLPDDATIAPTPQQTRVTLARIYWQRTGLPHEAA